MVQFCDLPTEIRLLVFKKVREEDLYETGRVCQDWFFLTLVNYKKPLTQDDHLLKDLAQFYGENSGKKKRCQWFDLVEHVGSKMVYIDHQLSKSVLNTVLKDGRQFSSLTVHGLTEEQLSKILAKFRHLSTLNISGVNLSSKNSIIPKSVKNVEMAGFGSSSDKLSQLFEDPSGVKSMDLDISTFILDLNKFTNLMKLTTSVSDEDVARLLQMVKSSTHLNYLRLRSGTITTEWFKLFPKNIKQLHLERFKLSKSVKEKIGYGGLYERELLFYMFQDWKSVDIFTSKFLDHYDGPFDRKYRSYYACKVKKREEFVFIDKYECHLGLMHLIFSETELDLRCLAIEKRRYNEFSCTVVPSTVKILKYCLEKDANKFSPYDICEDPRNLERLAVHKIEDMSFQGIESNCFRGMVNLVSLVIPGLSDKCITSILTDCTALKQLTIADPKRQVFHKMPANLRSNSIKSLRIEFGDDTLADMLKHFPNLESLVLMDHLSRQIRLPDPQILSSLQLLFVTCEFLQTVAYEMNKSPLPCAMFFPEEKRYTASYVVGSVNKFTVNVCSQGTPFAYARGLSTRPLEAQGTTIVTSAGEFNSNFY